MFSQTCRGEPHGLHGPPPQPMQPATAPIDTPVLVRNSPVPSELTPRNLKNCRLDDLPASYERYLVNSIRKELGFGAVPVRLTFRSPKNPFSNE